ncbi:MAG: energy transducer TonB [Bacteroidota bacterium]
MITFCLFQVALTAQTNPTDSTRSLETPTYDWEVIDIKTVDMESLGPEEPLRYRYVLIWDFAEDSEMVKDKTYKLHQLDQMPIFGESCPTADDPEQCSNEALASYVQEHLEYPEPALRRNHDGLEQLYFVLDEQGNIEGNIKVISKDMPCAQCAEAAVRVISGMPSWRPGRKNGQAVKTKIVLPVRFETI